jgi:hypothetical protein
MPNWCDNTLNLTHEDPSQIDRAIEAFKQGKLCEEFHPVPPELLSDNGIDTGWYNWRVNNWGTKWDVGGETAGHVDRLSENSVYFAFESAWSPPVEFYSFLVEELGFTVDAMYYEPGMNFAGRFYDGEDQFVQWSSLEEAREILDDDLDQQFGIIEGMEAWEEENE